MQNAWKKLKNYLRETVLDEQRRIKTQLVVICVLLALVSAVMTVVNAVTAKHTLMMATLAFAVLCLLDALLACWDKGFKLAKFLFQVEFLVLLSFFIVSGTPEGFSAIWTAMLPTSGLLLFQRKEGSILSAVMFAIMVFFFWTPVGRSFIYDGYTTSFMLRFPLLYTAFYLVALLLETMRQYTYDNYHFLYTHDALTGLLNRRGFADYCKKQLAASRGGQVSFVIADLDFFKKINDRYGHLVGDRVLEQAAQKLQKLLGVPVCRWGGEEFSALLDGSLSDEQLKKLCDDFAAESITVEGLSIPLKISVGAVVEDCTEGTRVDDLCLVADNCLYEAKNSGRNQSVLQIK